jgi:hypothetical protein
MSVLDWLRPKWKHSDPAVRELGVLALKDQHVLEAIINDDPSDRVRLAALSRITKESVLARFACRNDPLAMTAMKRLTDRKLIADVSARADTREVREFAVDMLDDRVVLHRIANSDTDPSVRLRARKKYVGRDATREVIQRELAKLQPAQAGREQIPAFSGTLDEVSRALVTDERFRISGSLDTNLPGQACVREIDRPAVAATAQPGDAVARFLALKRSESPATEHADARHSFFEICVWRTGEDAFHCYAEEKQLEMSENPAMWSRVSNGTLAKGQTTRH